MNISAKVEYACVAVLELAARWETEEPVRIRDIADQHGIPARFLVQILLQLKGAGLVQSTRGASGGYYLARSPDQITLADVMAVIDGRLGEVQSNLATSTPASTVLLAAWKRVSMAANDMLTATTFADLAGRLREQAEEMYYI